MFNQCISNERNEVYHPKNNIKSNATIILQLVEKLLENNKLKLCQIESKLEDMKKIISAFY